MASTNTNPLESVLSALSHQTSGFEESEEGEAGLYHTQQHCNGHNEVFKTLIIGVHEPQYVANHKHNDANNVLRNNLPEELISRIADFLPPESLRNLRASSNFFIRLLSGKRHKSEGWERAPFSIWPFSGGRGREEVSEDTFCAKCVEFVISDSYDAVVDLLANEAKFCDGCYMEHPRMDFPFESDDARNCFRWEGKVELCEHMQYSWVNALASSAAGEEGQLECPHHNHLLQGRVQVPTVTLDAKRDCLTVRFGVPVFEIDPAVPVTMADLQKHLEALDPKALGLRSCPHVEAGDGQLLLPFGPDHCACFEGERWISHDTNHEARSWRPDIKRESCCRCRGLAEPELNGNFMPSEEQLGSHHQYPCSRCQTTYSWAREGREVYLIVARKVEHGMGIFNGRWVANLDPASLGFRDERLRHVVWCGEKGCQMDDRWARLTLMWDGTVSHDSPPDEAEEVPEAEVPAERPDWMDEIGGDWEPPVIPEGFAELEHGDANVLNHVWGLPDES